MFTNFRANTSFLITIELVVCKVAQRDVLRSVLKLLIAHVIIITLHNQAKESRRQRWKTRSSVPYGDTFHSCSRSHQCFNVHRMYKTWGPSLWHRSARLLLSWRKSMTHDGFYLLSCHLSSIKKKKVSIPDILHIQCTLAALMRMRSISFHSQTTSYCE